jgi:hypothetical protein
MTTVVLSIDSTDIDSARLDRLTMLLYNDLRALKIIGVHRSEELPLPGGKSGVGQSIGELVLTGGLSAGVVTAVYKVIVAYLDRVKARSVTWTQDGREVTLTGLPPKEQEKMIKLLIAAGGNDQPTDAAEK